jgi:peroxiredoxin
MDTYRVPVCDQRDNTFIFRIIHKTQMILKVYPKNMTYLCALELQEIAAYLEVPGIETMTTDELRKELTKRIIFCQPSEQSS